MAMIWELPSWSHDELTEEQKKRYEVVAVGKAIVSSRTNFRVTCNVCGKVLHPCTNGPSYHMETHSEKCKAV